MNVLPELVICSKDESTIDLLTAMLSSRYVLHIGDSSSLSGLLKTKAPGNLFAALLDLETDSQEWIEARNQLLQIEREIQIIAIATPSPATVVTAMKNGATDFLGKPFSLLEVLDALQRAKPAASTNRPPSEITSNLYLGASEKVRRIVDLLPRIGPADTPVFIHGETGVGKEVFAKAIHAHSPRADKIFLKLNCAALPSELVESELFGYEKGAFTGAIQKKAGMFELADGGTLLLDEIGDMDFKLQAKLLQVLQDSTFQRLGGKDTVKVDVRIIAATHRNLEEATADGTFREDLYYRLNVISVEVPPLRERQSDILPLADHFIRKYTTPGSEIVTMSADLMRTLQRYPWPGNVRELENMMRRLVILREEQALIDALESKLARTHAVSVPTAAPPPAVESARAAAPAKSEPVLERVRKAKTEAETKAILDALNQNRWNRKQAARALTIDYKALLYKMKKLGIGEDAPSAVEPETAGEKAFKMGAGTV